VDNADNGVGIQEVSDNGVSGDGLSGDGEGGVARAIEAIPERTILTPDMFTMEPLGVGVPTTGYVVNPKQQAYGYVTKVSIPKGGYLRETDLVGPLGKDISIVDVIRPGLRGMVVPVTTNPTLHDLVPIGSYVDIVAAFDGQEARIIVQNVRVLAVDVFGGELPPLPIARRGANQAAARSDVPAPAPGASAQGEATPTPGPPPAPTPTPPPSAAPAPALTLEVTPSQATAISLAQAAGAPLDFLLRPRETVGTGTFAAGPAPRPVYSSRATLAPIAEAVKRRGATGSTTRRTEQAPPRIVRVTTPSSGGTNGGRGGGQQISRDPIFERPEPTVGPMIMLPSPPQTYEIPIYADGKLVRTETVRKPE